MSLITNEAAADNKKAKKILFDTYWSSTGWKTKRHTPSADLEFARQAGYMFKPEEFDHDKVMSWVDEAKQKSDIRNITNAFLASLSTRELDIRSALGSFAVLSEFPTHDAPVKGACDICGYSRRAGKEDLSVLNFERHKWGGVRHSDVLYAAFDLMQFSKLKPSEASTTDIQIMRDILAILRSADPDDTPRKVEHKLNGIFPSNKEERDGLLAILSYCGVLQPEGRSGYFGSFTPRAFSDHIDNLPKVTKIDWPYPLCWWRGKDEINERALRHYFPQL